MQKPTIGRIVHYCLKEHDGSISIFPAIVRVVENENNCALTVFTEVRDYRLAGVSYSEKYHNGCWSWPPREQV